MALGGPVYAQLFGRFGLTNQDGENLTPKSAKAQALVALILSSPNRERGRLWLQDKLWSTRAYEQGSSSLRQAVSEIKKSLGDQADVLLSRRQTIGFDATKVVLRPCVDPSLEFLEGLDVRDAEFDLWLSSERAKNANAIVMGRGGHRPETSMHEPTRQRRNQIIFICETPDVGMLQLSEHAFVEGVSKSVRDDLDVDILHSLPQQITPGMLCVSVQAFLSPQQNLGLRICVEDIDTNRILWSEMQSSLLQDTMVQDDATLLGLGNRLVMFLKDVVLTFHAVGRNDRDANWLGSLAVRKIFSMRKADLIEAEDLLLRAYEVQPRGVFQSWLAQLYQIKFIERMAPQNEMRDRADACCAIAMTADHNNSNVLANVANARLALNGNLELSAQLAQMSVKANKANPLAWWSLAAAHLYSDNANAAYACASNAQMLAQGTRLRFWADVQKGLSAILIGKTKEAIGLLETSSALAPEFHAPLRYATALYSAAGEAKSAQNSAQHLLRLEPDFSFDRLANDPDYPVSLMRKNGLLDAVPLE